MLGENNEFFSRRYCQRTQPDNFIRIESKFVSSFRVFNIRNYNNDLFRFDQIHYRKIV